MNGTLTGTVTIGGQSFSFRIARTAEGGFPQEVPIAAGVAGAISAAGVDGLAAGHGIAQGDIVDLHWTAVGVRKCRRGLTVDTTAAAAITFDNNPAAEGDALPAEDTAVVVSVQTPVTVEFDGDDVEMIALRMDRDGMADFREAAASQEAVMVTKGELWAWTKDTGVANPLAGNAVTHINVSNADVLAGAFKLAGLYHSV